jgi:hypothetical protein
MVWQLPIYVASMPIHILKLKLLAGLVMRYYSGRRLDDKTLLSDERQLEPPKSV